MKLIFLILFVFSSTIIAQVELSNRKNLVTTGPAFYYDLANYRGKTDSLTQIKFFLKVPFTSIQFLKEGNNYTAIYTVSLTFWDKNKKHIIFSKDWRERVSTSVFDKTTSSKNYNLSYKTFSSKPGNYVFTIDLEDEDSRNTARTEAKLKVRAFNDSINISDIILIAKKQKQNDQERIIPNISNNVTNNDSGFSFFFYVYSNKNRLVNIEYIVNHINRNETFNQTITKELKKGKNILYQTLNSKQLTLGNYNLIVKIKNEQDYVITEIKKKFHSKIFNFPTSITNLAIAINEMEYIASDREINFIKAGKTFKEKLKRFENFWSAKNPTPNNEKNELLYEYYNRVNYANQHFKGYYVGWKTDMGMVYITLGPPDQVERHPFEINSKPYEIWSYYNVNRSFIFVDQTGFGNYILINPDYANWYHYRR